MMKGAHRFTLCKLKPEMILHLAQDRTEAGHIKIKKCKK